ncbi:MAG: hypothetical protein KAY37_09460 [Phycisphaerae bacterium]|nr:hypothetical protein [Phycisphaerae bacterium]
MTFQQRATTIEQSYADDFSQSEESLSTTSPQGFIFVTGQVVAKRQPAPPVQVSPASLLRAYHTGSASALIEGGAALGTITEEFLPHLEPRTGGLQRRRGIPSRRERHAAVIALLDEWLADESGYDEKTWPGLKAQIEESRTSTRSQFGD